MVCEAEKASGELLRCGIDAEIIDLRSIRPLDEDTLFSSVKKTGRLIVADTGWKNCGIASEVSARAVEFAFEYLKSPIVRISMADTPAPTSVALERLFYPDYEDIAYEVKKLILGRKIKRKKRETPIIDREFKGPF